MIVVRYLNLHKPSFFSTFLDKLRSFERLLHNWLCLCCAQTEVSQVRLVRVRGRRPPHKVRRWSPEHPPTPEPDECPPLKQLPKRLVLPAGYRDPFLDFVALGGSIKELTQMYTPPPEWNDQLLKAYPIGTREFHDLSRNQMVYACTLHLSDELKTTKRQFLSFYNIKLVEMQPVEFMQWCTQNAMPNTCLDYMDLYVVARFYGKGTRILVNLAGERDALRVQLSDRFYTHSGWYRAVVIVSDTRRGMHFLFQTLMNQLDSVSYSLARSSVSDYRTWKKDERLMKWGVQP